MDLGRLARPWNQSGFRRLGSVGRGRHDEERRCPDHIDTADWQQAIEDSRRFLPRWGEQAATIGWTTRDLFGLPRIPEKPAPNYRRLSRYDETGLIWLLRGRPVVALSDATAAIEQPTGAVTMYRKHVKAPLGTAF